MRTLCFTTSVFSLACFLHLSISLPTKVLVDQLNVHRNDSASSSVGFKGHPVALFTPLTTSDFANKKKYL